MFDSLTAIDTHSYWAFVMRDPELGTRYFRFDLPRAADGEADARFGIRRVTLGKDDIKEYFDCSYHHYIQGAALSSGKIYSTEGFNNAIDPPAIRVIDLATGEETFFDIMSLGFTEEAEFIDFYNGRCFYSDLRGNLYSVEF